MKVVSAEDLGNPTLKGAGYRSTHKMAVIGILGADAPPVSSRGSRFFNCDLWTLRCFVKEMCEWASKNAECIPTRKEVKTWVGLANRATVPKREIVIANTPDKLTLRTALALTGGAYHEAYHTYYSCLRRLKIDEMCELVLPRWAKVPDWSKFYVLLQEWNNIIEDIRIEQLGRVEFPGSLTKLHDLQDFILNQESKGLANARTHSGGKAVRGALSIVTAVFRDVGLGYNTTTQQDAMAKYRAENPKAVNFVLGHGKGNPGPLTGYLKESIALPATDDLGCVRVAMDVIGVLYSESSEQDPANDPNNKEHQPGEGQKVLCPQCGAKGSKLVIRPKSDGNGGKVKGKGILTCSVCGFQVEVDLQQSAGSGKGSKSDPEYTPKFEGFVKDPSGEGGGEGAGGEEEGEAEGEGKGKGKGEGEGEGDDEGEGEGDDEGEDEGDGDGEGKGGEGKNEGKGKGSAPSKNKSNTDKSATGKQGAEGGGHCHETGPIEGNDWSNLADDAVKGAGEGSGLKDNNSALADAVGEETSSEERRKGTKPGEAAWSPYNPGLDEFKAVPPSNKGKDHDREQARRLYESVKEQASFLRSRLRQIVKAMEQSNTVHGIRRGRRLSPRFLVDSKVSLMDHQKPSRAYQEVDARRDVSLAAAIVIDESGSMNGALRDATRVLCAIAEPLDSLGCPVQVSGFRDGGWYSGQQPEGEDSGAYHRTHGIIHDVFKTFSEPLRSVQWRFANTRATGGTPMADGVQFGLDSLNNRKEGHRVLFVITDGCPNGGHKQIIRRQVRLAKAAGIHVIGVGLGYGAEYVEQVFPDSVWTRDIADMPVALIKKLNEIVDARAIGRGRRMKRGG